MTNFIAIVLVLIIIGFIRSMFEKRRGGEDSPLDQHIRLNEMKMAATANASGEREIASRTMKKNIENKIEASEENKTAQEKWDTFNLMEDILKSLGCQPKRGDRKELQVAYQGETFIINIGGPYAQIWDPSWAQINVNDPNFENMKTAANISNFDFGPSIVWTAPNDEGIVTLHSKRDILLCPQLQDNAAYVKSVLDSFFEKKERMRGQFNSLITQQQQTPKSHRPVGFATSEDGN